MIISIVIPVIAGVISLVAATDYCSPSLCRKGVRHIGCGHSGNFSIACSLNASIIEIDKDTQSIILAAHNDKRNLIAGGGDVNHDKACRMATIQWDEELASLAALNLKKCGKHDRCHRTDAFKFPGQSYAVIGFDGAYEPTVKDISQQVVNMWYEEVENSNMTFIRSFPRKHKGPIISHFTVMVADRNIRTGCAMSSFSKPKVSFKFFAVTCNYATTNMNKNPIYSSCKEAGTSCSAGTNPKYPNLCSTSEIYDVNRW